MSKVFNKCKSEFTHISNKIINESLLSAKAKWILIYMMSKPDGWDFYEKEIIKHTKDGLSSIRSGIKELLALGYLQRHRVRDEKGYYGIFEYWIYDTKGQHRDVSTIKDTGKKKSQGKTASALKNDKEMVDPFYNDIPIDPDFDWEDDPPAKREAKAEKVKKPFVAAKGVKKIKDPYDFNKGELPSEEHTQYDTNRLFRDMVDSVSEISDVQ
jgi:hypothetical protein